jgi:hypothetical protein
MSELILNEVKAACEGNEQWAQLLPQVTDTSQGLHVAVMNQPYLGMIFNGDKTVESRFSLNRVAPFGQVAVGDLILLKNGPLVGAFTATSVDFRRLNGGGLRQICEEFGNAIGAAQAFWQRQVGKQYATLVGIGNVLGLPSVTITKRDQRGWVVLRSHTTQKLF